MIRMLKETGVTGRFTEHDLSAKVGGDAKDLARAKEILAHADDRLTQRVYRRKTTRVKPDQKSIL